MPLGIINKMKKYISFDIGGTSIKYGILNENGEIIIKDSMDSEARIHGGRGIVKKIIEKSNFYKEKYDLKGVAISSHGMIDSENGVVLFADEHLIPNFSGMKVKEIVEKETLLACEIENDVNSAGLGELWMSDNISSQFVSMVTVGTGIGSCLIKDGLLLTGNSMCAGEIGKITIPGGRFEDISSSYAMTKKLEEKLNKKEGSITGKIVFEEIENGNQIAIDAVDEMIHNLAIGLSNLCFIYNPGVLILGGGIMSRSDYFESRLKTEMKKYLPDVIYNSTEIKFAKLRNDAGIIGALRNFLNKHQD